MVSPELITPDYLKFEKHGDPLRAAGYDPLFIRSELKQAHENRFSPEKRQSVKTIGTVAAATYVVTEAPGIVNFVKDTIKEGILYARVMGDEAARELYEAEDSFCVAEYTNFEFQSHQIQTRRVVSIGDSVLRGVRGVNNNTSAAEYIVNGMNTNYNAAVANHPNLPQHVLWYSENAAVGGTEVQQWGQQIAQIERSEELLDQYQQQVNPEHPHRDESIPQTWLVGCEGNTLFDEAVRARDKLARILMNPEEHIDELINFAQELQQTIQDAKVSYKANLESIYQLKQAGYNIDSMALIGVPDATKLGVVPVFDAVTQQNFNVDVAHNPTLKLFCQKAMTLINNQIKSIADEFTAAHPDLPITYIHTADLLEKEDLADIHPNPRGYWKIARKIMEHFKMQMRVQALESGQPMDLEDLALPVNDPHRPQVTVVPPDLFSRNQVLKRALKPLITLFES